MQLRSAHPTVQPAATTWTIALPDVDTVSVEAPNWLAALGRAIERMGVASIQGRLAAEVLPGGAIIIANDMAGRRRFVIRRGR